MLGLYCCLSFFLVVESRGYSLVAVHSLLIAVDSLCAGLGAHRFASYSTQPSVCGFRALEHRLSGPEACGIFLDQGSNPCSLHWQVDSLPVSHQGSPGIQFG